MSGDGSRIIYSIRGGPTADPLILLDRPSGLRIPPNRSPDGTVNGRAIFPSISADGQFVAVRADDAIVQSYSLSEFKTLLKTGVTRNGRDMYDLVQKIVPASYDDYAAIAAWV